MELLVERSKAEGLDKKSWIASLEAFKAKYGADTRPGKFSVDDKNTVIPVIVSQITQERKEKSPQWGYIRLGLETLKLLTREMKGLDSMYTEKMRDALMSVLDGLPDTDPKRFVAEQAYAVFVNMFIVDRMKMNRILSDTAKDYCPVFTRNLSYHFEQKQSRSHHYISRCIFYMALIEQAQEQFTRPVDKGTPSLVEVIANQLLDMLKVDRVAEDSKEKRQDRLILVELLRILFNLCYNNKSPAIKDIVPSDKLCRLKNQIVSVIESGVEEDPFGDLAAEEAFEAEAAKILAIAEAKESNSEEKEFQLIEDPSVVTEVKKRLELEKKAAEARKKLEEAKKRKMTDEDREEWNNALKRVEEGKIPVRSKPAQKTQQTTLPPDSLGVLKNQMLNILILPQMASLLPIDGTIRTFYGMCAILNERAKVNPQSPADHILPILTVLIKVCKESAEARYTCKRYVFKQDANKETAYKQPPKAMEPPPYVNLKTLKDENGNFDLRAILTKHICSFNMGLKQCVSELIYLICGEDSSEYIRLCGFGSAVGLLADKGLPGFEKVSQNAFSLDEFAARMKSAKK